MTGPTSAAREQALATILAWQQTVNAAWDQQQAALAASVPAVEEPPPPLPGPPPGSPTQNAAWWRGLDPADQLRYLNERPDLIAGLDGLPAGARDDANRTLLDRTRTALRAEAARLRAEHARRTAEGNALDPPPEVGPPSPFNTPSADLLAAADRLDQRATGLDDLWRRVGGNAGYDPADPHADTQKYYLLGFDNAGDGRAIVARGNPDTAADVATLVPGVDHDVTTVAAPAAPGQQNLVDRIDVLHDAAARAGSPSTSVIGWLGYDSPSGEELLGGTFNGAPADAAREDLESFQQGLRASHVGESHNTLIGHSYGSFVAGVAARDGDLGINDFVSVGSLGTGTQHASELGVANVWATEREGDWFADLGVHGEDPTDIRYGAKVFESDPPPGVPLLSDPHSGAFDDVAGNVGLENIAGIIAGDPPQSLHREPVLEGNSPDGPLYDYDPP